MKKKNLFFALFLALTMCLSLTACGDDDDDRDDEEERMEEFAEYMKEQAKDKNSVAVARPNNAPEIKTEVVEIAGKEKEDKKPKAKEKKVDIDLSVPLAGAKITSYSITENGWGEGGYQLNLTIEYTNNRENPRSYNNNSLEAYQNGMELDGGMILDGRDNSTDVKQGVTITVQDAFILRDLTSDVELEFSCSGIRSTDPRQEATAVLKIK